MYIYFFNKITSNNFLKKYKNCEIKKLKTEDAINMICFCFDLGRGQRFRIYFKSSKLKKNLKKLEPTPGANPLPHPVITPKSETEFPFFCFRNRFSEISLCVSAHGFWRLNPGRLLIVRHRLGPLSWSWSWSLPWRSGPILLPTTRRHLSSIVTITRLRFHPNSLLPLLTL